MKLSIYQVDAFSSEPFRGNPAAVCPLPEWIDDRLLQNIAMENALSETAFLVGSDGRYQIRWFTPTTEIALCGHATLASAYVVSNFLEPGVSSIVFESKSGELSVAVEDSKFTLNFPLREGEMRPSSPLLNEILGSTPLEYQFGDYHIALLEDQESVEQLKPDTTLIKKLGGTGLIITAKGADEDFVSRFFCPQIGIDEDPVTGAAHCYLAPFWAKKLGKERFSARQLSSRGGEIDCEIKGDRVLLSGNAALYMKGEIYLTLS